MTAGARPIGPLRSSLAREGFEKADESTAQARSRAKCTKVRYAKHKRLDHIGLNVLKLQQRMTREQHGRG